MYCCYYSSICHPLTRSLRQPQIQPSNSNLFFPTKFKFWRRSSMSPTPTPRAAAVGAGSVSGSGANYSGMQSNALSISSLLVLFHHTTMMIAKDKVGLGLSQPELTLDIGLGRAWTRWTWQGYKIGWVVTDHVGQSNSMLCIEFLGIHGKKGWRLKRLANIPWI